jgi:hypothetical protein
MVAWETGSSAASTAFVSEPDDVSLHTVLLLQPDGRIRAAFGDFADEWTDRIAVDQDASIPSALTAAARRLVHGSHGGQPSRHERVFITQHGRLATVDLLLEEAIFLRRTHASVRSIAERLTRVMAVQARDFGVKYEMEIAPDVPRSLYVDIDTLIWSLGRLLGNALRSASLYEGSSIVRLRVAYDEPRARLCFVIESGQASQNDSPEQSNDVAEGERMLSSIPRTVRDVIEAHGGTIAVAPGAVTLMLPR